MTEREQDSLQEVDALLGAYLARRAGQIDPRAGLARVRSALDKPAPRSPALAARFKPAGLVAGFAAALALALLGGIQLGPIQASALDLVQEVKRVHNQELERCYVANIERMVSDADGEFVVGRSRQARLWTRGDRFWVEMQTAPDEPPIIWGRDDDGAIWTVLDDHRGVRIMGDQAPRTLAMLADILSLNVDTLLNDVLHNCALVEEAGNQTSRLTRTVRALPRTRRTRLWLEEADLEIDTEARVLRRLILHRNRQGLPCAKLTFTLVETRPAHDDGYRLESRLTQPMHIFERPLGPAIRHELFARWMGPQASVRPSNRFVPKLTGQSDKLLESDRDLRVKAIDGKTYTPLATPNKKASLLLFVLPDCPVCNAYAPEIKRICTDYEPRGVNIFVVHADPDVTEQDARKHAKDYQFACPVLLDPVHTLVKRTGAKMAPEAAVLNANGAVVYLGRIDDLFADYGKKRAQPTQHDLRKALDALLAGKPVPAPLSRPIGCHIPPLGN